MSVLIALLAICFLENVASLQSGSGDVACPRLCNCNVSVVDCRNRGLTTVPLDLPDNFTHLYLDGNSISELASFSQVSANLQSLIVLNLDNNDVSAVGRSSLAFFPKLKELYLRHNQLTVIDQPSTVFSSLSLLRLEGNPFRCDCHLLEFRQWLETAQRTIDIDANDIHCSWPGRGIQLLSFQPNVFICDINECHQVDRGGCQQQCVNTYGSYSCTCNPGFSLQSDGKTCEDINECSRSSSGCTQGCMNLEGSYVCLCPSNLVLAADKHKCISANSESCPPEVTSDGKGTFPWQQTATGSISYLDCPVGFQESSSTMASNATRMCEAEGQWSNPDTSRCQYLSDTTRSLAAYAQATVAADNRKELAVLVKSAVNDATTLNGDDVSYATTALEQIVNLEGIDPKVGEDVIDVVSQLMGSGVTVLSSTSTRLIELVEAYGESLSLPFGIVSLVTHADSLAVRVVDSSPSAFDGAIFAAVTPSSGGTGNPFDVMSRNGKSSLVNTVGPGLLAGIRLPSTLLSELGTTTSPLRLQMVLYASSALFETYNKTSGTSNPEWVVGSKISSLNQVASLVNEIEIAIRHRKLGADEAAVCAYWDPRANGQLGAWLTDGCRLDEGASNASISVCKCNHLTNFAILLTPTCNGTDCDRNLHLEVYIGCGVSLFFICLLFLFLTLIRKQRTSTSMKIQKNFARSQILILVPFLAGIFRTSPDGVCQAVAAVLHFGLLSAIMWLATEALTFYVEQTRMLGISWDTGLTKRFLLAWGLPLAVVIILIVVENTTNVSIYGGTEYCWIQHDATLITTFYVPFGVLIVLNTVLFFLIHRAIGKEPLPAILLRLRTDAVTLLLFVTSVVFGSLVVIGTAGEHLALRALFITFSILHCATVFLLQCMVNVEVRRKISTVLFTNKQMLAYSRSTSRTTLDHGSERGRSSMAGRDVVWSHSVHNPWIANDIEDYYYQDIDKKAGQSRPTTVVRAPYGSPRRQEVYLSADGRAFYKPSMPPRKVARRGDGRYIGQGIKEDLEWRESPWSNSGGDDVSSRRSLQKSASGYRVDRTIDRQQTRALEDWPTPHFV